MSDPHATKQSCRQIGSNLRVLNPEETDLCLIFSFLSGEKRS